MNVGVVGASGYLGAELLRLLAVHPQFSVVAVQADSTAGQPLTALYPGLSFAYEGIVVSPIDLDQLRACDVVFVAVPSGFSQHLVRELIGAVGLVVDLGADFRLRDPLLYEKWYGFTHANPELLHKAVYGLVELARPQLHGARLVAAPGCYVTAASLALAPLISRGMIERSGVIIDAASGTSGAGKEPLSTTHHATVNENFVAYGVTTHRHTPEIEQATGANVLFTPHLAPMTRGILATIYAKPLSELSTEAILSFYRDFYRNDPFIVVTDGLPATRDTYGSNYLHLGARFDERTNTVILFSALDNLTKGGAGQALQAANVVLGLDETAGLPKVALVP